jgi:DNA polymerase I-like protein with 3'-5' exonuclease and polymerase domains
MEAIVLPTYSPYHLQKSFSDRGIVAEDIKRAVRISHSPVRASEDESHNFIVGPTLQQVVETLTPLIERADAGEVIEIGNDIETRQGHIACIGIAWTTSDAICIPLMRLASPEGYWTLGEEVIVYKLLHRLLTHPNVKSIGQNFIYDAQYYYRHLLFVPNFGGDTMLTHHTMFSNQEKSLAFLSSIYCEQHVYWKEESKDWQPSLGETQLWIYNCKDCVRTLEIFQNQKKAVEKFTADGWTKLPEILKFQHDLWWAVLESMNRGIRVLETDKAKLSMELMDEIAQREAWRQGYWKADQYSIAPADDQPILHRACPKACEE